MEERCRRRGLELTSNPTAGRYTQAALKNEHVHDEKKDEIRQRLDEMEEPYDA